MKILQTTLDSNMQACYSNGYIYIAEGSAGLVIINLNSLLNDLNVNQNINKNMFSVPDLNLNENNNYNFQ